MALATSTALRHVRSNNPTPSSPPPPSDGDSPRSASSTALLPTLTPRTSRASAFSLCPPSCRGSFQRAPLLLFVALVSAAFSLLLLTLAHRSGLTPTHPFCGDGSLGPLFDGVQPPLSAMSPSTFTPPAPTPSCLCSSMYDMSTRPTSTWQLLSSRLYAEADACPALIPRSALVHAAPPLPGPAPDNGTEALWQAPPCMAMDVWLMPSMYPAVSDPDPGPVLPPPLAYTAPVFSIQYTVFNQETVVLTNLHAALSLANPREPFELVLVFDDCSDDTIPLVHAYLQGVMQGCRADAKWPQEDIPSYSAANVTLPRHFDMSSSCLNPALVHVRTLVQPTGVWETAANNIGARAASPHAAYLVFVQDDHVVEMQDWNSVMAFPMRVWGAESIVGVSGRCGESKWSRRRIEQDGKGWVGRCNVEIGQPLDWSAERRCSFYIRDSVNRGPLLISHATMKKLGYFDEGSAQRLPPSTTLPGCTASCSSNATHAVLCCAVSLPESLQSAASISQLCVRRVRRRCWSSSARARADASVLLCVAVLCCV